MQRDPTLNQESRLRGFTPESLDAYNAMLHRIIEPPKGYEDTTTFYEGVRTAEEIQKEFLNETPIYESLGYAVHAHSSTNEDVVSIMQGREINSYTLDRVQTPREVENTKTERHWNHLLRTLPADSKISFSKGYAVIDFGMMSSIGIKNNGTMILDLESGTEKDGFIIINFFQTGRDGTLAPTTLFNRENIEVRFKEEHLFVRWFRKKIDRFTMASAGREQGKNILNLHEIKYNDAIYTDIPIFFHEFSHIKDMPRRGLTKNQNRILSIAYLNGKYLPLASSATTMAAMLGTAQPWMILATGSFIVLDRILHKMSRNPESQIGDAMLKTWKSEVEARFSQKIAADLMSANGFTADFNSFPQVLDFYQPGTWTLVDQYTREVEEAIKKRLPQPVPQPASVI